MELICHRCMQSLRRQKLLCSPAGINLIRRQNSTSSSSLYRLDHRGVIRVAGPDSLEFLQGLVTNDTEKLRSSNALYSLMLNVQGRVLYDMLLYNASTTSELCLLLECDKEVVPDFIKLMKRYKIRRKVNIADVGDEFKVFASLSSGTPEDNLPNGFKENASVVASDPRISSFGCRFVTKDNLSIATGILEDYHIERHKIGLSEGVNDLPPGNCFPLESNAVFLNGVSFDKGCYIGQELTARTFYTGVTRKRLMPLVFSSSSHDFKSDDKLVNSSGKTAGKIRSVKGTYGLGLVRLGEALSGNKLPLTVETANDSKSEEVTVSTQIPSWWDTDTDEVLKNIAKSSKAQ